MAETLRVPPPGFDQLPVEKKVEYVETLWERIIAAPQEVGVPDWHQQILRDRSAEYRKDPKAGRPWRGGVAGLRIRVPMLNPESRQKPFALIPDPLILARLTELRLFGIHPGRELLLAQDGNVAAHAVVPQATQLRAGDLVQELGVSRPPAHLRGGDGRREPDCDRE